MIPAQRRSERLMRAELAGVLHRAAVEAERQHPGRSVISPCLGGLAKLCDLPPGLAGDDWAAIAAAAFREQIREDDSPMIDAADLEQAGEAS